MMEIPTSVLLGIFGVLFSIIGSLCSILLSLILKSQAKMSDKLLLVLSRLEALEIKHNMQNDLITMLSEEIKQKCDKNLCYYLQNRNNLQR